MPASFRRLRAGVHGHPDVGLRERRRVVRAVAGHGDEISLRLLLADQRQLVFRRRLGEEVVDAGFARDRCRGQRVVAGDHHRADAHHAQTIESLLHPAFDDVFEIDRADDALVLGDDERRSTFAGDLRNVLLHLRRKRSALRANELGDRVGRAFADRPSVVEVEAGHARLRGERNEVRAHLAQLAAAKVELLLRQNDDRPSLRCFVRERRELRDLGELLKLHSRRGRELRRLTIAERDRAGLVEKEHVHVARGFDGAARHRQDVVLEHAIHSGDADRGEQRADRRGDQADEERDEHRQAHVAARVHARTA